MNRPIKKHLMAISPFQTEVIALLMAVQAAAPLGIKDCTFNTDSEVLVKSLQDKHIIHMLEGADWQSYTLLARIGTILVSHSGYSCQYIPREENFKAHQLANWARKHCLTYTGFTYPLFSLQ